MIFKGVVLLKCKVVFSGFGLLKYLCVNDFVIMIELGWFKVVVGLLICILKGSIFRKSEFV